ncbi:hypothetical protein FRC08_006768 [Ceratobasidium sp. 394]|nr:hypothetical protein FRC08_006768 [Ceratobasidium sp. 394]
MVANGTVSVLLVPLYLPSHWVLLAVDITTRRYCFTDTLCLNEQVAPPVSVDIINRWLSCLLDSTINLVASPRQFQVGQQADSDSCGVAVISSIAHLVLGGPSYPPWTQDSTVEHRLIWGLRLASAPSDIAMDISSYNVPPGAGVLPFIPAPTPATAPTVTPPTIPINPGTSHSVLRQTTLPIKKISLEEWRTQEKQQSEDNKAHRVEVLTRIEYQQVKKKMKKREYERKKKRAQRARRKAEKQALLGTALKCDEQKVEALAILPDARLTLAAMSRPFSKINAVPVRKTPARPKKPARPTRRINWSQEFLWKTIDSNARAVGFPWRPVDIVKRLQTLDWETFQYLRPQRISQWRDNRHPFELRWKESHLQSIKAGSRPKNGLGQQGIFHNRPDVVETIKKCLLSFRQAGIALNVKTIRGYMVGVIRHCMPGAFSRVGRSGRKFNCSDHFVRHFLRYELGWSLRKATRAAQKHPHNINKVLLDAFLRMACTIRDEAIPAACIVNADQTQVVYSSGDPQTWNPTGERQVNVVGLEDKRAFTLLVSAALSGDVLPFQAIYAGKTKRSVPDPNSPGYDEATRLGFLLDYSGTDNYWSSLGTMKRWVLKILVPYFSLQKEKHGLPASQKCILQIDCWSVHHSQKFLDWMNDEYPWIDIKFIPAGCTGLFQACDVGIQRFLKAAIHEAAHADIVAETVEALQAGTEPRLILNDQSLPTLRRRSVGWLLQGFHAINRPSIIQKAFALCVVPDTSFCLSYSSLTGRDARQALRDLVTTDPHLYAELSSGRNGASPNPAHEALESPFADMVEDDLDETAEEASQRILAAQVPGDLDCLDGSTLDPDDEDYLA